MNESRKDKSLYTLTKKFVEMLKTEQNVDLNIVTNELQCAKKRRIYDVSNVLEGIGLIKKTQKNLYSYTGKTYKEEGNLDQDKLIKLKAEKESLESLEKQLDEDISNMKMNLEALKTDDSYLYLTRQDLIDAFSKDRSMLVVKDYRNINVMIEDPEAPDNNLIHVHGYIVKPITCKLVNTENADKELPKIEDEDFELISNNNNCESNNETIDLKMFDSQKEVKKSDDMVLFRKSIKPKTYFESDPSENEKLSENVLSRNEYEEKSKFYYVSKNKLLLADDYTQPDFISIEPPADAEYYENYSNESPSIHDLFDCRTFEPSVGLEEGEEQEEIDDDQEMIEEEYIIEELDEESYEMLQ